MSRQVLAIALGGMLTGGLVLKAMAGHDNMPYDFAIRDSQAYRAARLHDERRQLLQVPARKLKEMTAEALVITCLNYPFLCDFLLFNDSQTGFDVVAGDFGAIGELLMRPDNAAAIFRIYSQLVYLGTNDGILAIPHWSIFAVPFCEVLLAQPAVLRNLDSRTARQLLAKCVRTYDEWTKETEFYARLETLSRTMAAALRCENGRVDGRMRAKLKAKGHPRFWQEQESAWGDAHYKGLLDGHRDLDRRSLDVIRAVAGEYLQETRQPR